MSSFDPAIEAQLSGRTVRIVQFVAFDFRSGMVRVHNGFGDIVLGANVWRGLGEVGRTSASNAGPGQAAEEWTYEISADAERLQFFSEDIAESVDREVFDYFQFFDDDWQPLGDMFQWRWGIMGPLTVQRPPAEPGQRPMRSISVTAMNAFTNRKRPANAFYSHLDQQGRYPGDNICSAMSTVNRKIEWPKFS